MRSRMAAETACFEGTVHPRIALAILEALRDTDTPDETLAHETFPRSLPRRLGLSGVVENQIRRYAGMRDRGAALEARELADLVRLVGRRPDAERVFTAAGRALVRSPLGGRGFVSAAVRLFPRGLRRRRLLRRMRRISRAVSPEAEIRDQAAAATLTVTGCLPARATGTEDGCRLLEAAFTACAERYRAGVGLVHAECEGRGAPACVWRLEPPAG